MDYFKKYEEWCNSNIFDEKTKKELLEEQLLDASNKG